MSELASQEACRVFNETAIKWDTRAGNCDLTSFVQYILRKNSFYLVSQLHNLVQAPRQRPHVLHAAPAQHLPRLAVCLAHARVPALETLLALLTLPHQLAAVLAQILQRAVLSHRIEPRIARITLLTLGPVRRAGESRGRSSGERQGIFRPLDTVEHEFLVCFDAVGAAFDDDQVHGWV